MRPVYWLTPAKVPHFKEFRSWTDASESIPDNSWVYDPTDVGDESCKYGVVYQGNFIEMPKDQAPAEFKAGLLLLGGTA